MTRFDKSHTPRKRFGQNFLRDPGVTHRIVSAIHPREGEHLVDLYSPQLYAAQRELIEARRAVDRLGDDATPFMRQSSARTLASVREKLSLWGLIESLQRRFEDSGLEPSLVDAAVVFRVGTLLSSKSKNDQRRLTVVDLCPKPV